MTHSFPARRSSDLTAAVSFRSVPSFAFAREIMLDSREWGPLQLDIAYGGAFYAILPADSIGLELRDTPARQFAEAGAAISEATRAQVALAHPDDAALAFLYRTHLNDRRDAQARG